MADNLRCGVGCPVGCGSKVTGPHNRRREGERLEDVGQRVREVLEEPGQHFGGVADACLEALEVAFVLGQRGGVE